VCEAATAAGVSLLQKNRKAATCTLVPVGGFFFGCRKNSPAQAFTPFSVNALGRFDLATQSHFP
jgi:hypothetical protein